jgi:hypothetical protein
MRPAGKHAWTCASLRKIKEMNRVIRADNANCPPCFAVIKCSKTLLCMNLHSAARHSVNSHPGKCHESADETILENDEMGIYLNPGYENFRRAVSAEIYVEKR